MKRGAQWAMAASIRGSAMRSVTATVDGGRSADRRQRIVADRLGDDLLVARLLVRRDVAVGDGQIDRPRGPLGLVAGVDRPDAILGQKVVGELHRVLWLFGSLRHDRYHPGLVLIDGTVGFDHA